MRIKYEKNFDDYVVVNNTDGFCSVNCNFAQANENASRQKQWNR